MEKVRRFLLIFGMGMAAIPGFLFLAKMSRLRFRKGNDNSADKSLDDKLRKLKVALEKATALLKGVINVR
ncbi:MAG: hypothetical protein JXA71_04775 [Chitinispirillaceae bacterium]|nr:hypothetical protein [Chitinispirillaceae bacterium]